MYPTINVAKYVRQKLIDVQRERNESIIVFGDFNIPPSEMDKSVDRKSVTT